MKQTTRLVLIFTLLCAVLPVLQGCFGAALVGTTVGVLAVADRRSIGVQADDTAIELKVSGRLGKEISDVSHINVTSYNRRVLLTGEVPNETVRMRVAEEVARIENVQSVWNELVVAGNSSFASRSNDSYISSKVKARFIDANEFSAHHVKVVTEAGVVFLLGIVSKREADAAVQVARTTAGVRKVARFTLLVESDEEIRRIDASLTNAASSNKK
ncbi:MAG: BON domain-containing protein [Zoogloeaceae bacterium]|jgi:osmotically-inducible protein OsmY|nr:BON domain-containing protein [Zoogloeaceae bacterium]